MSGDGRPEAMSAGVHKDGRAVTIPIHGGREIGPPLYHKILSQLGISPEEFQKLE